MAESEARWFAREVNRPLRALLGRGWGKVEETYGLHPGEQTVEITRQEDIDRLPEVVETLRGLLARGDALSLGFLDHGGLPAPLRAEPGRDQGG